MILLIEVILRLTLLIFLYSLIYGYDHGIVIDIIITTFFLFAKNLTVDMHVIFVIIYDQGSRDFEEVSVRVIGTALVVSGFLSLISALG